MSYRTLALFVLGLALVAAPLALAQAPRADLSGPRALALEGAFHDQTPSVALSTVYKALPEAQKLAMAAKLKAMVVAHVPADIASHPALAQLPPEMRAMVVQIALLGQAATPAQIVQVLSKLDLDHLAPIPAPLLQPVHDKMVSDKVPGSNVSRKEILTADLADPQGWAQAAARTSGYVNDDQGPAQVEVLAGSDPVNDSEVPVDSVTPALDGAAVHATQVARFDRHALVNSVRLARAFNLLARPDPSVSLKLGERTVTVTSGEALVRALVDAGYEVNVFDARMFVDFLGYSVLQGQTPIPVRIPTWIATNVDSGTGRKLIVPANHSEHIVGFFRKGQTKPEALVRWYMGIPDGGKQGTLFKPAVYRRCSWSGWRVVRAYDGAEAACKTVRAATRVMQSYNFIQERYAFPRNGYGILGVCNDTTGVLEVVLQGGSAGSTVWPMVRDPRFDAYLLSRLADCGLTPRIAGGLKVLDVPCDARPDLFPEVRDSGRLMRRIGANLPTRDLSSLQFPELKAAFEHLSEQSAELREGLSLAPANMVSAAD